MALVLLSGWDLGVNDATHNMTKKPTNLPNKNDNNQNTIIKKCRK